MQQIYKLNNDKKENGQISDMIIIMTNGATHSVNFYCNRDTIVSDLRKLAYEIEQYQLEEITGLKL